MDTLLLKTASAGAIAALSLAGTGCTMSTSVDGGNRMTMGGNIDMTLDQDDDLSLMGGDMTLNGRVGGDVSVIGGDIEADLDVGGDLSFVGGEVNFRGSVHEASIAGGDIDWNGNSRADVSIAGGDIRVAGTIGGELNVAGGELDLPRDLRVEGDASTAGGEIDFSGHVRGEYASGAREMRVGGVIEGPVKLAAEPGEGRWSWRASADGDGARAGSANGLVEITGELRQGGMVCARNVVILNNARISGTLRIWSDNEPDIRAGASVGEIVTEDRAGRDCDDIFDDHDRA
ncbi:hypothetical protein [Hyphobacterium marinum]|uniref:Polymer-forming cytoskeletal protein n=1 Tax=Hyphobacterium marinum TaxID=3116574 RepID=A0ABU7LYD6_9PROT|nr:hypothetical protein [Hyphobacterium sp. Y6023]MEE2566579.1 hypothetical protein [Hyphobacterium sp. Y6023]